MRTSNYLQCTALLMALSVGFSNACSSGGLDEIAGPPSAEAEVEKSEQALDSFVAGTRLYAEKLSATANLELWDQGKDGILLTIRGHKDYDADKEHLLAQAIEAEGSESVSRIYRHLNPTRADIPKEVRDVDQLVQERLIGRAATPTKIASRPIEAAIQGDQDTVGELVKPVEPTVLPLEGQADLTWMAIWFRDTFCTYPGHDNSTCLLDRNPNPYIQQSSTGKNHIITANTDYYDIRFRGYSTDCQFWCSYELRWDERVTAGHWAQHSWLGSSTISDRRGRIDSWDSNNKSGPLNQFSMTWKSASGGGNSSCKALGQSCTSSGQCCLVSGTAQCIQGVCRADPTPGSGCDWFGEFCCGGTATSATYCNRTADPNLRCNSGVCGH